MYSYVPRDYCAPGTLTSHHWLYGLARSLLYKSGDNISFMKLNFRSQNMQDTLSTQSTVPVQGTMPAASIRPVVLIHGLFGNLDNLGVLARDLQKNHPVIQLDLRNHGLSPRSPQMNYPAMAQDVVQLLTQLEIEKAIVIGHSMGGKVAMAMTAIAPQRVEKLIVIDIAPVAYQEHRHDQIFLALKEVTAAGIKQRQAAASLMHEFITEEQDIIPFLVKSFHDGEWRFDVPILCDQYSHIAGWQPVPMWSHPVLFIRGESSPYIQDSYRADIVRQFPQARVHVISGCGHAVHAEKPDAVLRAIHRFIYHR